MTPRLNRIDDVPNFPPPLDKLLLNKLALKRPDTAHILERVAEETQYRQWLVERVVEVNNAMVASQEAQEKSQKGQEQILRMIEEMARSQNEFQKEVTMRVSKVETVSSTSASTILDWTVKFKSPLALLGSFIGIVVIAVVGALVGRFIK